MRLGRLLIDDNRSLEAGNLPGSAFADHFHVGHSIGIAFTVDYCITRDRDSYLGFVAINFDILDLNDAEGYVLVPLQRIRIRRAGEMRQGLFVELRILLAKRLDIL